MDTTQTRERTHLFLLLVFVVRRRLDIRERRGRDQIGAERRADRSGHIAQHHPHDARLFHQRRRVLDEDGVAHRQLQQELGAHLAHERRAGRQNPAAAFHFNQLECRLALGFLGGAFLPFALVLLALLVALLGSVSSPASGISPFAHDKQENEARRAACNSHGTRSSLDATPGRSQLYVL